MRYKLKGRKKKKVILDLQEVCRLAEYDECLSYSSSICV